MRTTYSMDEVCIISKDAHITDKAFYRSLGFGDLIYSIYMMTNGVYKGYVDELQGWVYFTLQTE